METVLNNDLYFVANGIYNTLSEVVGNLEKVGLMRAAYKVAHLKNLAANSKTVIAFVDLAIAIDANARETIGKVGEAYGLVKAIVYAANIVDSTKGIVDSLNELTLANKKMQWYEHASKWLLFSASIFECADFAKKYGGIKTFPIFTDAANFLAESELFKTLDSPLLNQLFTKRPKDFFILSNSILILSVNFYYFNFGTEDESNRVVELKNILVMIGEFGKAVLIITGVSYAAETTYKAFSLGICLVADLKYLAFD